MTEKTTDKGFADIDQFALDKEWIEQPRLYLTYATQLAEAKLDMAEIKNQLEVSRAEVSLKVRMEPAGYGLEKVTESTIDAVVTSMPEVVTLVGKLNKARYEVDVLEAAVSALDHRKKALENLVYLHGQSYFAAPKARTVEDREGMEDARSRRIRDKTSKGDRNGPR